MAFHESRKMTDAGNVMNPLHFWERSRGQPYPDKSGNSNSNPRSFFGKATRVSVDAGMRSLCAL